MNNCTPLCAQYTLEGENMDFVRITDKVISRKKIEHTIDNILNLRQQGYSQQEVATKLKLDRTFISRLESCGEIRKGNAIAVIGFPIYNKGQVIKLLEDYGVDYYLIMTEKERWNFVKNRSGIQLLDEISHIMAKLTTLDTIVIIGSNQRIKIFEAIYPGQVVGIEIGESPIEEDKMVDVEQLAELLKGIQV